MADGLPRIERAALGMLAAWMGERFFRTFRVAPDTERGPFDAVLTQREHRVGVTIGVLWDAGVLPGLDALEAQVSADVSTGPAPSGASVDGGAYALWVPPRAALPDHEPAASEFRLLVTRGLGGLAAGERRELRVPALLRLAKVDAAGAYVSVSGGLAPEWTRLSENAPGAFHLDSRAVHRLPEEAAERELLISRVRDKAALLETGEFTTVDASDYWLISRLPGGEPRGLTVFGAPTEFDSADSAAVRRLLRAHVARAEEQRYNGTCDLTALLVIGSFAHMEDERVTAGLRGMNPAAYGGIDLMALVADGQVRQVLQPRALPWAGASGAPAPA